MTESRSSLATEVIDAAETGVEGRQAGQATRIEMRYNETNRSGNGFR